MTDMAAVIARLRKLPDSPMRRSIEEVLSFTMGEGSTTRSAAVGRSHLDDAAMLVKNMEDAGANPVHSPASIFNDTEGRN